MRAPMMEIDPVVTDWQWAGEWSDQLENLLVEVGELFPRVEVRRRAADFVRGLLGPISRKNGWQLAEYVGDEHAWGLRHLLSRAVWEPDAGFGAPLRPGRAGDAGRGPGWGRGPGDRRDGV